MVEQSTLTVAPHLSVLTGSPLAAPEQHDRDERISLPDDPEDVLRALVQVEAPKR